MLLALVVLAAALTWWLWSEWTKRDGAADPIAPSSATPTERDGRLSRSERRALEAELQRTERDLAFARGQMHANAQAETRAAWRARVEELTGRCDALRAKLGR